MSSSKPRREKAEERRRAKRTIIQESFNLFMALPEAGGMARIYMRDFSRLGLRFFTDFDLGIRTGQVLKTRIYLNPTFYLPVECKVVRSQGNEFGAEFLQPDHPSVQALAILQDFFDAAEKAGVLSS